MGMSTDIFQQFQLNLLYYISCEIEGIFRIVYKAKKEKFSWLALLFWDLNLNPFGLITTNFFLNANKLPFKKKFALLSNSVRNRINDL